MATPLESIPAVATGAGVTGLFAVAVAFIRRKKSPGEVGDTIANAFGKLVDQLQEENASHLKQIDHLREEGQRLRGQLAKLRAFAELVIRHIASLEQIIKDSGGVPPDRPELPALD